MTVVIVVIYCGDVIGNSSNTFFANHRVECESETMNSTMLHQQGLPLMPQSEQSDVASIELQSTISPNSPQMDSVGSLGQNITFPKLNEIRRPPTLANETKVIYHLKDKDCPTVIKIPIASNVITLRDLKNFLSLPKSHFKFYFKSFDKDVGVVKEQIFDDNSVLPLYQNMVVAFVSFFHVYSSCRDLFTMVLMLNICLF